MSQPKPTPCLQCGFSYDQEEFESCPQCHANRFKMSFLKAWSETVVSLPMGGKAAFLLTSNVAIFTIFDSIIQLWWINLISIVVYDLMIWFWFSKKKAMETSIWLIILILILGLPVFLWVALVVY